MSLYVMVWIVLCVFGLGDFFFKASYKTKRVEFICLVVFLSIILVFRFGQGQDYFSYRYIYNQMPQNGFDFSVYKTVHGEIGYLILCNFFRCLHIPFEGFIACTALFEMVCFYRFCTTFQIDTPFILVLAYPTLYMTYFMSIIRQGIAIAVFLGILLPLYFNRRFKHYIIVTILCASIHSAALMFLLVLFLDKVKRVSFVQCGCFLSWVTGIVLTIPTVRRVLMSFGIDGINYYMKAGTSISIIAACERIFFLGIVTWLYLTTEKKKMMTLTYQMMYLIYLTSIAIYGFFVGYSNIASRLSSVMRFVELFLLIDGIKKIKFGNRQLLVCFFMMLESVMFVKNMNSYIQQGEYHNKESISSYEYVSIFNEKKIFSIRNVEEKFLLPDEIDKKHQI